MSSNLENTKVTLPFNFIPRDYQLPFLEAWDSGINRFILVWHRRSGKDKTCFANLPKKMFEKKAPYFYFAPTYKQGKKIIWDNIDSNGFKFLDHIPKSIIKNKNENELKIELTNGSYVQIVGTDNIDSVMGSNPFGCIFTEFSLQHREAWDYIRPILAENGGWAVFVFTPRGTNHAWELLQMAKSNPKWFTQILTVDDTDVISKDSLAEEKAQMPDDLFQQEFYCKFIDGASQFFRGIEKVIYTDPFEEPMPNHEYKLGTDLGKSNDYTVVTPFDLMTFKVGKQERFNQIDYNLQKSRIVSAYSRFNKPTMTIDSTGVGDPISDDLSQDISNLERFTFTQKSRMDLLTNLQLLIQQQKIKIPNDPTLIAELKSFEYDISDNGKIGARCDDNLHDDCVMSLALAVWNIPTEPLKVPNFYQQVVDEVLADMSIDPKTGYFG
jgi:hypothetical protein